MHDIIFPFVLVLKTDTCFITLVVNYILPFFSAPIL